VETFENDGKKQQKPIIHFRETNLKPLVSNKTNFMLAVQLCGKRTEDWPGKQIVLYPTMVTFKGQVTESIRISQRRCRLLRPLTTRLGFESATSKFPVGICSPGIFETGGAYGPAL
jgi:hypothetical protein